MPSAHEFLDRARRAASIGNYPRADRYLERASALADDSDVEAQVEITRAYVEAETGDPAGGIERCQRILDRGDLTQETAGKAWQQLGLLRMRTGESDSAMDAFAHAVALLLPGIADLGYALLNRGNVHLQTTTAGPGGRGLPGGTRGAGHAGAGGPARHGGAQPRLCTATDRRPRRCPQDDRQRGRDPLGLGGEPRHRGAGPRRDPDGGGSTARGDPGAGAGRAGVRLTPAAHLPGRVRADPRRGRCCARTLRRRGWWPAAQPGVSAARPARRAS